MCIMYRCNFGVPCISRLRPPLRRRPRRAPRPPPLRRPRPRPSLRWTLWLTKCNFWPWKMMKNVDFTGKKGWLNYGFTKIYWGDFIGKQWMWMGCITYLIWHIALPENELYPSLMTIRLLESGWNRPKFEVEPLSAKDYSGLTKGMQLQAEADGKYWAAEVPWSRGISFAPIVLICFNMFQFDRPNLRNSPWIWMPDQNLIALYL